ADVPGRERAQGASALDDEIAEIRADDQGECQGAAGEGVADGEGSGADTPPPGEGGTGQAGAAASGSTPPADAPPGSGSSASPDGDTRTRARPQNGSASSRRLVARSPTARRPQNPDGAVDLCAQSTGEPLPPDAVAKFSAAFDHPLGHVRIHTDGPARAASE